MGERTCKICGKIFTLNPKGYRRLYCSNECARAAKNSRRRVVMQPKYCRWCNKEIIGATGRSAYCGDGCRRKAKSARQLEWIVLPANKAKRKAYQQTEQYKAAARAHTQTDKYKERRKTAQYKATAKRWRGTDKGKACRKRREARRAASDPRFRLSCVVRSAVRGSLANKTKHHRWQHLLGWTTAELKAHLEKRFEPWMSWDNYGEWHIDHIIPIAAFNYKSPYDIDFKRCWALSNLRPLEAGANQRKGAKLESAYQPALAMG